MPRFATTSGVNPDGVSGDDKQEPQGRVPSIGRHEGIGCVMGSVELRRW